MRRSSIMVYNMLTLAQVKAVWSEKQWRMNKALRAPDTWESNLKFQGSNVGSAQPQPLLPFGKHTYK